MLRRGFVADLLGPGGNAIGLLRFGLALLVMVHHTRVLGGFGSDPVLRFARGQADLGVFAVAGFFTISGFLVTRSAERSSLARYLWHRTLRVFPAFWVCLLVIALVFGPFFWLHDHGTLAGYADTADAPPLGYLANNVFLLINQTQIDHLLAGNPYPNAVNGSLWTLVYEFSWYLVVAALALFGLLRRRVVVLGLVAFLVVSDLLVVAPLREIPVLGYAFTRFGLAFSLGMAAYLWRERIPLDDRLAALAAVVFVVTLRFGFFSSAGMAALAYGVLWLAWRLPLRRFGTRHDLSYGVYIYAFPVQQTIALLGGHGLGPPLFLAASLAGTLPLAFLSQLLVERPALRLKDAQVVAGQLVVRPRAQRGRLAPGVVGEGDPNPLVEPALGLVAGHPDPADFDGVGHVRSAVGLEVQPHDLDRADLGNPGRQ
jgi:peptidoglycan/LPS O-acetylase OafA/YrhL